MKCGSHKGLQMNVLWICETGVRENIEDRKYHERGRRFRAKGRGYPARGAADSRITAGHALRLGGWCARAGDRADATGIGQACARSPERERWAR